MSEPQADDGGRRHHLEIPIEPLPTEPLVPRVPPPEAPSEAASAVASDPVRAVEHERPPAEVRRRIAERDDAGGGALRPSAPPPAMRRPTGAGAARFSDRRHPFRASFGLVVLVIVGSLALAGAIGVAIAVVAFAVRQAVS